MSTSLETDGDFLYYEAWEDFNGMDTFTYTARDADGQESTATVTITVTAVNDAPDIVGGLTDTMIQGTMKTWDGRYASEGRPSTWRLESSIKTTQFSMDWVVILR